MKILAFDFSSTQRSVAVHDSNNNSSSAVVSIGEGSTPAMAMVKEALDTAKVEKEQIEALAVGLGPGSYTGIRVALSIAKGWQLASPIEIFGASSILSMARVAQQSEFFGLLDFVVDAHGGEFYHSRIAVEPEALREVVPIHLIPKSTLEQFAAQNVALCGPDFSTDWPTIKPIFPHAKAIAELSARPENRLPLEPIYLRETRFIKAPPSKVIA